MVFQSHLLATFIKAELFLKIVTGIELVLAFCYSFLIILMCLFIDVLSENVLEVFVFFCYER